MLRIVIAAAMLCALLSNAEARARRSHHGLPWCGIYMSKYFGKSDRRLWVAREWARVGRPASGPEIGAVVVWRHHVGVITGKQGARVTASCTASVVLPTPPFVLPIVIITYHPALDIKDV